MKRALFAIGCLVAVLPGVCSAALSLRFDDGGGPFGPRFPVDALGRHYVDLVFTETPPTENEGLFAYDLGLRLTGPGNGARLTGAEIPPDNFVLDVPGGANLIVAENTGTSLIVNVSSNNNLADINSGDKAARIFYQVDPGVRGQDYGIVFDVNTTVFGSGDPERALQIDVALADGFNLPEPGGMALLALSATLFLRRRRPAAA